MKNMITIAALLSSATALTVTQEVENQMAEADKVGDSILAEINASAMEGESECVETKADCSEQGCCWRRWPPAKAKAYACMRIKRTDALVPRYNKHYEAYAVKMLARYGKTPTAAQKAYVAKWLKARKARIVKIVASRKAFWARWALKYFKITNLNCEGKEESEEEKSEESEESEEEESETEEDDGKAIKQVAVGNACNGPIVRLLREKSGNIAGGSLFTDVSFPPTKDSMGLGNNHTNATWARPIKQTTKPSLFGTGINVHGVRQGGLGDCWLLASISAVAEHKEFISQIFNGVTQYPSNGQFKLGLYFYGERINVVIDDNLPASMSRGAVRPRFTKPTAGGWWVPILEKGMAKYWGNYWNMNGGWMGEAFTALTGCPSTSVSNKDAELWNKLKKYDNMKAIMSTGTSGSYAAVGLVGGHAYTTIGVAEYNGEKLVIMRNPWSVEKYTGPWNDKSSKWTAAAKKALNHVSANDGKFYVPLSVYKSSFGSTVVGFLKNWQRRTARGSWKRSTGRTGLYSSTKFTVSNSQTQTIAAGYAFPTTRNTRDRKCATDEVSTLNIRFCLKNSSGQSKGCAWATKWDGAGYVTVENAPAGKYTAMPTQGGAGSTGTFPFAKVSLGDKKALPIS